MVHQAKPSDNIGHRAKRALGGFEQQEIAYFYDLPPGVGRKTMDILVERGHVQVVHARVGPYAKDRAWRLRR
jgi:hypothetical protein